MANSQFKLLTLASLFLAAAGCTPSHDTGSGSARKLANYVAQPAAELGESWSSTDEAQGQEIVGLLEEMLKKRTGTDSQMKRDAHPKGHGCAKAFFKIESSGLPPQSRVGLFAHDQQEFKTWIRFSNGDPDSTKADAEDDVRGLAIKVMGVPDANYLEQVAGEPHSGVQDFVLMNSPVFFIHNTPEYVDLMKAVDGNTLGLIWFMVTHGTTRSILSAARGMKVGNPLHIDFWSATPYKLGKETMKFFARSCEPVATRAKKPSSPTHDYLKEALVQTLSQKDACFDFLVQRGDASMPIEDPTQAWDESTHPYVKVGTIRIPKQTGIDSEAQLNFCENMNFNPWRAPADNRPLGQINRVRLQAYGQISSLRHEHNRIPQLQPSSHEPCTGETAQLCKKN